MNDEAFIQHSIRLARLWNLHAIWLRSLDSFWFIFGLGDMMLLLGLIAGMEQGITPVSFKLALYLTICWIPASFLGAVLGDFVDMWFFPRVEERLDLIVQSVKRQHSVKESQHEG